MPEAYVMAGAGHVAERTRDIDWNMGHSWCRAVPEHQPNVLSW